MATVLPSGPPKVPLIHNRRFRSIAYQTVLTAVVLFFVYQAAKNAIENLARANIATGFGFWNVTAGFDISQTLIEYSPQVSSNGRAFLVGLLNTLLVAGIGIVLATMLGFVIGLARLSPNWLLARLAGGYVELVRNLPLLFQILFWYLAVLAALPNPRQSISLLGWFFLSNRGLYFPVPMADPSHKWIGLAFVVGIVATYFVKRWAKRRQDETGLPFPTIKAAIGLIVGLPVALVLAWVFDITPGGIERTPDIIGSSNPATARAEPSPPERSIAPDGSVSTVADTPINALIWCARSRLQAVRVASSAPGRASTFTVISSRRSSRRSCSSSTASASKAATRSPQVAR